MTGLVIFSFVVAIGSSILAFKPRTAFRWSEGFKFKEELEPSDGYLACLVCASLFVAAIFYWIGFSALTEI